MLALLALAAGCAAWTGSRTTPAGAAADWRRYERVQVTGFTVAAASRTPSADAARAAGDLERRVSAALRDTGRFTVSGPDTPAGPHSLSVGGVVTRAVPGSAAARELGHEVAGRAEFAAEIEVRDTATGRLLATLRTDRRTGNVERKGPPPETLDAFLEETAGQLAATLAKARQTGRFPAATPPAE